MLSTKTKFAAALLSIILLITVTTAWVMVSHGLEMGRFLKRQAFEGLGLERHLVETNVGAQVVFASRNTEAPTVVLVHGFGDDASTWSIVAQALIGQAHLVVPDLAGHGDSGPTGPNLSYEDAYQALVLSVNAQTNGTEFVLVGNSLGGWLAARYTLDFPGRVKRLILVNAAALKHPIAKDILVPTNREALEEKLKRLFPPNRVPKLPGFFQDQLIAMTDRPPLNALFDSLLASNWLDDQLATMAVPTDLIWGTPDGFFPLEYGRRLETTIPLAKLHELPGCGHAPQMICGPELSELLLDLLGPGR